MPVDISDILHVLAHELRTPVGIAHGYVRMLLDDRLTNDADRRRALEQMKKALGRLSDLSQESSTLAAWFEQERTEMRCLEARRIMQRVAEADYDWPVTVDPSEIPDGPVVRTTDGEALGRAVVTMVRATARELRGATCDVIGRVVDGHLEVLAGPDDQLDALRDGPEAPGAGPLTLERGGLGLALVHAAVVLDAHGARRWTMNGSRQTVGLRLPTEERPHQ